MPDAEVVAVGSRTAEAAAAFGERFRVDRRQRLVRRAVADPEVDVVYVATPHPFHAEHALQVIGSGKPVLVEKPFAMDAIEARAIADAARVAGVFCMEAMWTRFLPHLGRLRELLAGRRAGRDPGRFGRSGHALRARSGAPAVRPELGGGAPARPWASTRSRSPRWCSARRRPCGRWPLRRSPRSIRTTSARAQLLDRGPRRHHLHLGRSHPDAGLGGRQRGPDRDRPALVPGRLVHPDPAGRQHGAVRVAGRRGCRHPLGRAKGLRFEAAEVGRCLRLGLTESPVLSLDETVSILGTLDEVRDQIGLAYPSAYPAV